MNRPFVTVRINATPRIYNCEPEWRWAPPPLGDYDRWYVIGGQGELRLGGARHQLHSGAVIVLPPGSEPRATQRPDQRLQVLAFHFDAIDSTGATMAASDLAAYMPLPGTVVRDQTWFTVLGRQCARNAARKGPLAERQTRMLAEQMLLHLCYEAANSPDRFTEDVICLIAAAIQEAPGKNWSVERQAAMACLSRSRYTRRFTSLIGRPPRQFAIDTRLARAAQLLHETDMTIGAIAAGLGYPDLFFFGRQFKHCRGVAPSALRMLRIAPPRGLPPNGKS